MVPPGNSKANTAKASAAVVWRLVTRVAVVFLSFLLVACVMRHDRKVINALENEEIFDPVGRRLILFCQSDPNILPATLDYLSLPEEFDSIRRGRVYFRTDGANLVLGGGLHHFGYKLRLDEEAVGPNKSRWNLFLFSEDNFERLLRTFEVDSGEKLTREVAFSISLDGCRRHLRSSPRDQDLNLRIVNLFLELGEVESAFSHCKEWIRVDPDFWLPRFTTAHVHARLGGLQDATKAFEAWVMANPSYSHLAYLGLFCIREQKDEMVGGIVQKMLGYPVVEAPRSSGNRFYLGFNFAVYSLFRGEYELCKAVCKSMLEVKDIEKRWYRRFIEMNSIVHFLDGQRPRRLPQKEILGEERFRRLYEFDFFSPFDQARIEPYPVGWRERIMEGRLPGGQALDP